LIRESTRAEVITYDGVKGVLGAWPPAYTSFDFSNAAHDGAEGSLQCEASDLHPQHRVLQLLKIPYTTLPDLHLHLKILQKLPLLLKIHHLHNQLSIILYYVTLLLILPLHKIHQLNNLLTIILHHVLLLQTLLLTLLPFKIHHLHNILSINLYYVSLLLTLPLLKIHQLNKLFKSVLFHMFILQSLLTLPLLLLKFHQLNKLFNIILLCMFILQSLLLTLPLLFKIHQLHTLFSLILHHVFLLQCLLLILPLLLIILQMLQRSRMPLWMNPALILRPQWRNCIVVLILIK
jgi:hypothetical protein